MPIFRYGVGNPAIEKFTVDEDAIVWRYMDVGKYLDLLIRKSLWFTRGIELRKTDPYEGRHTSYDFEKLRRVFACHEISDLKALLISFGDNKVQNLFEDIPDLSIEIIQFYYYVAFQTSTRIANIRTNAISCWHSNSSESDAMWALYAQRNAGIAIRSSIKSLMAAFRNTHKNISIGKVLYDSDETLTAMLSSFNAALFIKRHSFSHENEVRMIADFYDGYESSNWTEENQLYSIDPLKQVSPGLYIDCDLNILIEEIIISPLSPVYLSSAIKEISSRFLPGIPVRQSTLIDKQEARPPSSDKLEAIIKIYERTGRFPSF